jgi:hypothetical protein
MFNVNVNLSLKDGRFSGIHVCQWGKRSRKDKKSTKAKEKGAHKSAMRHHTR